MFEIQTMDALVPHEEQLKDESLEPVELFNVFHVAPDQVEAFIADWSNLLRDYKMQPGLISTQLYRGTAGSGTVLVHAVWESVAHYRAGFTDPAFQARLTHYPDSTVASPFLFRKVAVSNICTD